jgi:hypothetical protein
VTKNCVDGGGIVVMEDIDAMTPVVLRRTHRFSRDTGSDCGSSPSSSPSSSQAVTDLVGSGGASVTLDYFLNLLQGTLTLDGMVFVTTTNHLEALDPAFYRPGRFGVVLELRACDRHQVHSAFRRFLGRDPSPDVLARVEEGRQHARGRHRAPRRVRVLRHQRGRRRGDPTALSPRLSDSPHKRVRERILGVLW